MRRCKQILALKSAQHCCDGASIMLPTPLHLWPYTFRKGCGGSSVVRRDTSLPTGRAGATCLDVFIRYLGYKDLESEDQAQAILGRVYSMKINACRLMRAYISDSDVFIMQFNKTIVNHVERENNTFNVNSKANNQNCSLWQIIHKFKRNGWNQSRL